MIFSSIPFFVYFFPLVLLGYYPIRRWRKASNIYLTLASLGFYLYGVSLAENGSKPALIFLLLGSVTGNWLFAILVDKYRERRKLAKGIIALTCVFNLGLLSIFKYVGFAVSTLNGALGLDLVVPRIILPLGISFMTFQAMSYVIDVYRQTGRVQKSWWNVCLYISFFPQLIAGPIVRYETVAEEITGRRENLTDFSEGMRRFLVGFAKKVILANNLGILVDTTFALQTHNLSIATSWLAACAYLMQVYYDFSGYSDMAIGLGRMFGFHFLENFRMPFIAKSVAEFWRRWHISLGSWFQDYLYFPLGGSRVKTTARLLFNMFVVWSLTGLWHGAQWTYVLWGVAFFVLLAFERLTGAGKWMEKHWVGHIYAMLVVVVLTVMIRAANLGEAWKFYGTMFGVNGAKLIDNVTLMLLREYGVIFLASLLCGLPVVDFLRKRLHIPDGVVEVCATVGLATLLIIAIGYLAIGSYNPFIYGNF